MYIFKIRRKIIPERKFECHNRKFTVIEMQKRDQKWLKEFKKKYITLKYRSRSNVNVN